MVTIEYIAISAHKAWMDKGTLISMKTLISLGIPVPERLKKITEGPMFSKAELMECMANNQSPMDLMPTGRC